jgi:dethiobiotin synthetase
MIEITQLKSGIKKMQKGIFISATSTGVGKTVLSAILSYNLALAGFKVAYFKPVQTGAPAGINGCLYSSDCRFVNHILKDFPGCNTFYSYLFKNQLLRIILRVLSILRLIWKKSKMIIRN